MQDLLKDPGLVFVLCVCVGFMGFSSLCFAWHVLFCQHTSEVLGVFPSELTMPPLQCSANFASSQAPNEPYRSDPKGLAPYPSFLPYIRQPIPMLPLLTQCCQI